MSSTTPPRRRSYAVHLGPSPSSSHQETTRENSLSPDTSVMDESTPEITPAFLATCELIMSNIPSANALKIHTKHALALAPSEHKTSLLLRQFARAHGCYISFRRLHEDLMQGVWATSRIMKNARFKAAVEALTGSMHELSDMIETCIEKTIEHEMGNEFLVARRTWVKMFNEKNGGKGWDSESSEFDEEVEAEIQRMKERQDAAEILLSFSQNERVIDGWDATQWKVVPN